MKRLLSIGLLLLAIAAAAQGDVPRYKSSECPFFIQRLAEDSRANMDCGYLIVPEDRHDNQSDRLIQLFVVRIAAREATDNAPLIYMTGGPGSAVAEHIPFILASRLSQRYEVIAMDQRGAGFSRPSLNCFELDDKTPASSSGWIQDCYQRLRDQGIGLQAYSSASAANDIYDLLVALEIGGANLYGVSFGSRLALTVARDHPERVRALLLDGVFPPHVNRFNEHALNGYQALERLFTSCGASADCRLAYPDLREKFYDVIRKLNATPATIPTMNLTLTGDDFANDVLLKLYDKTLITVLPAQIEAFVQGEYDYYLAVEARKRRSDRPIESEAQAAPDELSEGAWLSFRCADEAPFNSREAIVNLAADLPVVLRRPLVETAIEGLSMCRSWNVPASADIENQLVDSDIPTLLLSGYFDPATPPHWGDEARRYLSNSWHYEFPDSGHGVLFAEDADCAESIALSFLEQPTRPPDAACLNDLRPPRFHVRQNE